MTAAETSTHIEDASASHYAAAVGMLDQSELSCGSDAEANTCRCVFGVPVDRRRFVFSDVLQVGSYIEVIENEGFISTHYTAAELLELLSTKEFAGIV